MLYLLGISHTLRGLVATETAQVRISLEIAPEFHCEFTACLLLSIDKCRTIVGICTYQCMTGVVVP